MPVEVDEVQLPSNEKKAHTHGDDSDDDSEDDDESRDQSYRPASGPQGRRTKVDLSILAVRTLLAAHVN